MMPRMIFRPPQRLVAILALMILGVQGLSPVFTFSPNPLLVDTRYCGTRIENTTADVVVIRAPLTAEASLPAPHTNKHCPLCYIHTPSFITGYAGPLTGRLSNPLSTHHFSSTPNNTLQQQHLQRLAPTHAPPYFA